MQYPPTFLGFLKAVFDTLRGKKLRPRIPKDESARDIDDYEGYDSSKDPGMEFWHTEAQKLAERKEQEKAQAERQMIRDYELEHREDANTKTEAGKESDEELIIEGIDGSDSELEMDEDGTDDFGSDADFDTDMEGSFDSGFDSDGCPDYIG